jgi:HPt (histidine-containing phosphotransfer) domain-containing protein
MNSTRSEAAHELTKQLTQDLLLRHLRTMKVSAPVIESQPVVNIAMRAERKAREEAWMEACREMIARPTLAERVRAWFANAA